MGEQHNQNGLDRRTFLKLAGVAGGLAVIGLPLSACAPAASNALYEGQTGGTGLVAGTAHATWYVGEAKGFFAEEGIKNILNEFQGGTDAARALTDGGMGYVSVGTSPAVTGFMQGAGLRIIGSWWQPANSIAYAVKADAPYKTIQDLKGKKIGYSRPASLSHFFVLKAIQSAGLSDKDFNLVPVGGPPESRTALNAGLVDASWQPEVNMAQGVIDKSLRTLFWGHELVKEWQDVVIGASDDFVKSKPDVLKRFLRACQKTLVWEANNREEAGKLWAKAVNMDPNVAIELLRVIPKEAFTTKLSAKGLGMVEESLRDFKLIDKPVPWKNVVDQSLLPADLRADI